MNRATGTLKEEKVMLKLIVSVVGIITIVPCILLFVIGLFLRPMAHSFLMGFYFIDNKMHLEKEQLVNEIVEHANDFYNNPENLD